MGSFATSGTVVVVGPARWSSVRASWWSGSVGVVVVVVDGGSRGGGRRVRRGGRFGRRRGGVDDLGNAGRHGDEGYGRERDEHHQPDDEPTSSGNLTELHATLRPPLGCASNLLGCFDAPVAPRGPARDTALVPIEVVAELCSERAEVLDRPVAVLEIRPDRLSDTWLAGVIDQAGGDVEP